MVDLLAIAVHPDDIELCAAGTVLKHKDLGYKVGILDLTQGELGTRGTKEIRLQEAMASAEIAPLDYRANVGLSDGFFQYNETSIRRIIPYLRHTRPDIVLINARWDRHPDHARASKLVQDACFYAGLLKIKTLDPISRKEQERWRPKAVYQYIQDYTSTPDLVVDITAQQERKLAMIKAFKSQFYDPQSKEPTTPISTKDFLENVVAKDRVMGRFISVTFGEGFHKIRPIGVRDLFHLD